MTINEIRPFIFIISFTLLYLLQKVLPVFRAKDHTRIIHNWYVFVITLLIMKSAFPNGLAFGLDKLSDKIFLMGLNDLPLFADVVLTILIFDLAIYFQHRLMHKVSFLWRLHKVHHSDQEMDTTTALRFHPLEILFSAFYKIALLLLLSPRLESFIIYEVLLNCFALFNHSNLKIPTRADGLLRILFVTPAMHFPHHSTENEVMNKNFGNILSIWDKLFGTYTTEENSKFGIKQFPNKLTVKDVLMMPFK